MALEDLYREVIIDHYRNPRNRGTLADPDVHVEGHNPLCGDQIAVDLRFADDGELADIAISGQGCSISQAAASMMTTVVKGRQPEEIRKLTDSVKAMLNIANGDGASDTASLGDLVALQGVRKYPVRVKCATLSWNTLAEGLSRREHGERAGSFTENSIERG